MPFLTNAAPAHLLQLTSTNPALPIPRWNPHIRPSIYGKQGDVQAILDMASKIDATGKATPEHQLTSEIESRFWEALSHVSNTIKPASAVALRERSRFLSVKKSSLFSSTIEYYKRLVWFLLAVTLLFHCYYFIVGALIADAKEGVKNFDQARTAAFTAIASNQQRPPQPSGAMANSDTSIIINVGNTCEALKSWHSINDWIARVTFQFASVRSAPGQSGNAGPNPDAEATDDFKQLCLNHKLDDATGYLNRLRVVDERTRKIMSWASKIRDVVSQFILPLLYGALGAITSIIRELSISIRQIRYSRSFGFEYSLKIPLGALAGATVGLIVAPETLNTAFGLTMLGVAFGFGYSVDVFFALLDGLIGRLTQQAPTPQSALQRTLDPAEVAAERIRRSGEHPGP